MVQRFEASQVPGATTRKGATHVIDAWRRKGALLEATDVTLITTSQLEDEKATV